MTDYLGTKIREARQGWRDILRDSSTQYLGAIPRDDIYIFIEEPMGEHPDVYPQVVILDDEDISPFDLANSPTGYFMYEHKFKTVIMDRGPDFAVRMRSIEDILDNVYEEMVDPDNQSTTEWRAHLPTGGLPGYVKTDKVNYVSAFVLWSSAMIAVK